MKSDNKKAEFELAAAMQRGDKSVLRHLYDGYAGYLSAVCSRYLCQDEALKDVLQETYVRVYNSMRRFEYRGEGSVRAWLTRIAVNESLRWLRENDSSLFVTDAEERGETMDYENVPDVSLIESIPMERLMECIRSLSLPLRTAFNLLAIESRNKEEVAQCLGISLRTLNRRYSEAKKQLSKMLINEI